MAWTAPRTWVAGEVVTAALLNTHVRDNLSYLKDLAVATPTLGSNVVTAGEGSESYRKGDTVTLAVYVQAAGPVAAGGTLLTVADGYRPPRIIRGTLSSGASTVCGVTMSTAGVLTTEVALETNALLYGHMTYVV